LRTLFLRISGEVFFTAETQRTGRKTCSFCGTTEDTESTEKGYGAITLGQEGVARRMRCLASMDHCRPEWAFFQCGQFTKVPFPCFGIPP
jgi:hypothetical protein